MTRKQPKPKSTKAAHKNHPAPRGHMTPPTPGGRMTPPTKGVKVRMYRTGLGDCFLMAFPRHGSRAGSADAFYLLVDCGVYKGTREPNNKTRIAKIVTDIRAATGGHLDVLVITHEHWDHVSAFHHTQSQAIFDNEITLGTLWMAWTENLNIKLAKDLHDGRKAARAALTHALEKMKGLNANNGTSDLVRKVLDFFGEEVDAADGHSEQTPSALGANVFAAKGRQTEEAMTWIRDTYGKDKTKFLHPGDGPLTIDGVADARVYILGPPEDPTLIKHYNPSASGAEVYPKAMAAAIEASFFATFGVVPVSLNEPPAPDAIEEAKRMSLPFDETHQVKIADAQNDEFFKDHYYDPDKSPEWRRIEGDWLDTAGEFALQLDSATNNTSLAFALEIGPPGEGKVLLFPGDAQVGNWQSWFGKVQVGKQVFGKDMVWDVAGKKVTAEDLLRRTVLYKVGHHGSHNGTLRAQGLELMGRPGGVSELIAMLPVDEHVARDLAHYGEMPLGSLVKELTLRTGGRVLRSDDATKPANGAEGETDLYFERIIAPPK